MYPDRAVYKKEESMKIMLRKLNGVRLLILIIGLSALIIGLLAGWCIAKWGHLPISETPPTWSDVSTFFGGIGALSGAIFLYIQINRQSKKDRAEDYQSRLRKLFDMLETIRFKDKTGTEAIVKYGECYENVKHKHPHIVVDKVSQLTLMIESFLIDLSDETSWTVDKGNRLTILSDLLMFFYNNLYHTLTFERKLNEDKAKGIIHQLDLNQYRILIYRINDLKIISYNLLLGVAAIDTHTESEGKNENDINSCRLKQVFKKLKGSISN